VQDLIEDGAFKELYKHIYSMSRRSGKVLRFRAISTDGGVDLAARFWVCTKVVSQNEYWASSEGAHKPTLQI
jgi:hypothetical protein